VRRLAKMASSSFMLCAGKSFGSANWRLTARKFE
jgi:hypothetical protein